MTTSLSLAFTDADLCGALAHATDAELDALDFGVIRFDASGTVCRYNQHESKLAGLSPERVLGHSLFKTVAPCMNNFLVAQRFEDSATDAAPLDAMVDYVLTLRMRPMKVQLRLLAQPGALLRYVLVLRRS